MINIYSKIKASNRREQLEAQIKAAKHKENAEKRKAENHAKYMIGGVMHKYFPDAYSFDEGEWCIIAETIVRSKAFKEIVNAIADAEMERLNSEAEGEQKAKSKKTKPKEAVQEQEGVEVVYETEQDDDDDYGSEPGYDASRRDGESDYEEIYKL